MTTKDKIISGIKNLPDSVTIDVILDQIMLVENIEKGIKLSNKNQVVSDDELDKRLGKWLV
jgi:TusA-related sulfurtransferase